MRKPEFLTQPELKLRFERILYFALTYGQIQECISNTNEPSSLSTFAFKSEELPHYLMFIDGASLTDLKRNSGLVKIEVFKKLSPTSGISCHIFKSFKNSELKEEYTVQSKLNILELDYFIDQLTQAEESLKIKKYLRIYG